MIEIVIKNHVTHNQIDLSQCHDFFFLYNTNIHSSWKSEFWLLFSLFTEEETIVFWWHEQLKTVHRKINPFILKIRKQLLLLNTL